MPVSSTSNFTADSSGKYIMSIRLRPDGLSFYCYNPDVIDSLFSEDTVFDQTRPYIENLKEYFFTHDFLNFVYKRIYVINVSSVYTLVPEELFSETEMRLLLPLVFSEPTGHTLENQLKEQEAHLVFDIDEEVYAFCARSFVNPSFTHYMSLLLKFWKRQSRNPDIKQLFVAFENNRIDMACFHGENLLFVNSYTYSTATDILYYTLYVWKQIGLSQEDDRIHLHGEAELKSQLSKHLRVYIQNVCSQEIPSEAFLRNLSIMKSPLDIISLMTMNSVQD